VKPEDRLRNTFRDRIVGRGGVAVVYPRTRYARSGVSDLLVCYRGRYLAIEVKLPGGSYGATPSQVAFLEDVYQAGGIRIIAREWDDIEPWLNVIDRAGDQPEVRP